MRTQIFWFCSIACKWTALSKSFHIVKTYFSLFAKWGWVSFPFFWIIVDTTNIQAYLYICGIYIYICIFVYYEKWKLLSRVWLVATHRQYSPRNSLGQNTGVGSLSRLQGIFPTQGSNPGLPHCRWILYQLSHKGSQVTRIFDFAWGSK